MLVRVLKNLPVAHWMQVEAGPRTKPVLQLLQVVADVMHVAHGSVQVLQTEGVTEVSMN